VDFEFLTGLGLRTGAAYVSVFEPACQAGMSRAEDTVSIKLERNFFRCRNRSERKNGY